MKQFELSGDDIKEAASRQIRDSLMAGRDEQAIKLAKQFEVSPETVSQTLTKEVFPGYFENEQGFGNETKNVLKLASEFNVPEAEVQRVAQAAVMKHIDRGWTWKRALAINKEIPLSQEFLQSDDVKRKLADLLVSRLSLHKETSGKKIYTDGGSIEDFDELRSVFSIQETPELSERIDESSQQGLLDHAELGHIDRVNQYLDRFPKLESTTSTPEFANAVAKGLSTMISWEIPFMLATAEEMGKFYEKYKSNPDVRRVVTEAATKKVQEWAQKLGDPNLGMTLRERLQREIGDISNNFLK